MEAIVPKSYGARLRYMRESAGITQAALAARLGRPQKWLCIREREDVAMTHPEFLRAKAELIEFKHERDAAFAEAIGGDAA